MTPPLPRVNGLCPHCASTTLALRAGDVVCVTGLQEQRRPESAEAETLRWLLDAIDRELAASFPDVRRRILSTAGIEGR